MRRFLAFFVAGFLLGSGIALAQGASDEELIVPLKRWSFFLEVAATFSGPAPDIEKAMIGAGLNGPIHEAGQVDVPTPYSKTHLGQYPAIPWMAGVGFKLNSRFSVAAVFSKGEMGYTFGHTGLNEDLEVKYAMQTLAPVFFVHLSVLELGAGPAWYSAKIRSSSNEQSTMEGGFQTEFFDRLGVLLIGNIVFPENASYLLFVTAQYRGVGEIEIGPYVSIPDGLRTLPRTKINMNHFFVGIGIGFRL